MACGGATASNIASSPWGLWRSTLPATARAKAHWTLASSKTASPVFVPQTIEPGYLLEDPARTPCCDPRGRRRATARLLNGTRWKPILGRRLFLTVATPRRVERLRQTSGRNVDRRPGRDPDRRPVDGPDLRAHRLWLLARLSDGGSDEFSRRRHPMLGGMIGYTLYVALHLPSWVVVRRACSASGLFMVFIDGRRLRPAYSRGVLAAVMSTFGLSFFMENGAQIVGVAAGFPFRACSAMRWSTWGACVSFPSASRSFSSAWRSREY